MKTRTPRKLKKQLKKKARISEAISIVAKACAAVATIMSAYRIAMSNSYPVGGIVYKGEECIINKKIK
jgi:hypothetical protein